MKTVKELSRDQLIELKRFHLSYEDYNISYYELADADNIISDEEIYQHFDGVYFSDDDFSCSAEA